METLNNSSRARNHSTLCEPRWARRLVHALVAASIAGAAMLHEPSVAMVGPRIRSITWIDNTCSGSRAMSRWTANVELYADDLSDGEVQILAPYGSYELTGVHLNMGYGYNTSYPMHGSVSDKLSAINNTYFGTGRPTLGAVVTKQVSGGALCDPKQFVCVGLLITKDGSALYHPELGELPTGLTECRKIPPTRGSCTFEQNTLSQDLGTVKEGEGIAGSATLKYSCSGSPPNYRISLVGGGTSVKDSKNGLSVGVKIDGGDLPWRVKATGGGQHSVPMVFTLAAPQGVTGKFSARGVLLLEPE